MTRFTTYCLLVTFTALALVATGCAGQEMKMFGDHFSSEADRKTQKIEDSLDSIGSAFATTGERKMERLQSLQETLKEKYNAYEKPDRLVFFSEDETPEARPAQAAAAAGPGAAAAVADIQSTFLSEQVLEHRGLRLMWKLPLDGSAVRFADLNDGKLYIITTSNILYCIDQASGLTEWIYNLKRRPDGPPGFNSKYVVISAGDTIRVINKDEGVDEWLFETDVQPCSRPYVTEYSYAFGCWNGDVCGFEFGRRFPRWRLRTGSIVTGSPIISDTTAMAATDDKEFIQYETVTKFRVSQVEIDGRPVGDLATAGDLVFIPSENYELIAMRISTGGKAWTHSANGRASGGLWVSVDENTVYYSAANDGLYALTATTGKEQWRVEKGVKAAAVSGYDVYVLGADGNLMDVDGRTGKVVWSESIAPFVGVVSQAQNDIICLISSDGQIYAVKPKQ